MSPNDTNTNTGTNISNNGSTDTDITTTIVDANNNNNDDDNNNDDMHKRRNMMMIMMMNNNKYGQRLVIPEWIEEEENHHHHHHHHSTTTTTTARNYRSQNGWLGNDLIHSSHTSNVYLIDSYYVQYCNPNNHLNNNNNSTDNYSNNNSTDNNNNNNNNSIGTTVTGLVHFTKNAESHRGYCHGGAACSIMDDIIGWTAFCCNNKNNNNSNSDSNNGTNRNDDSCNCIPWSGYTVQINTTLCKPIPIDSYLYIQGMITNIIRRKVYVTATLYDIVTEEENESKDQDQNHHHNEDHSIVPSPKEERIIYATCEGIVVMNPGILPGTK